MTEQSETLPAPVLSDAEQRWRLNERQALAISKASTAVPKAFSGKPGDIMAVWMMADELGISRMAALRGMYVVNGKPQLSGDLLLAVARGAGCKVQEDIEDTTPKDAKPGTPLQITAYCTVTLPDGEQVVAQYNVQDAIQADLWGKTDPWRKYPKRMLQMRARGFALRDAVPHLLAGVYAPGEIIDVTPEEVAV